MKLPDDIQELWQQDNSQKENHAIVDAIHSGEAERF